MHFNHRYLALALLISSVLLMGWGFFSHQKINRISVFTLPPEMLKFYKYHIQYLAESAVNPDKRRYIMKEEAARHYIDLDEYGDSAVYKLPRYWDDAVTIYGEDTLQARGIVPWHIQRVKFQLTKAYMEKDAERILKYAADLGHYIADAHVPLHTTSNYNGQFTNQYGIHGFWESRLPELFFEHYDLFTGTAQYIRNTQFEAWKAVESAHLALDSVLLLEKQLTQKYDESKKYSFENKGNSVVKVYASEFSADYHDLLDGMVERQMRAAIKMIGDFWFTAWVDAGQPDLDGLIQDKIVGEDLIERFSGILLRNHESGEVVN